MTPPVISFSMVGHSALLPLAPYSSFTFFFWGGFCFWFFYFGDSWENQTIGVKDSVPPHSSIYKTFFSCFLLAHPSDFNGQQQQQQQWLCPLRTTRQHIFLWFFFFWKTAHNLSQLFVLHTTDDTGNTTLIMNDKRTFFTTSIIK